jgi:hypothetical protein
MHTTITRAQNVFGFFTTVCFVVAAFIACSDLLAPRTPSANIFVKDVQVFVTPVCAFCPIHCVSTHLNPYPRATRLTYLIQQSPRQTTLLLHEKRRIRTHPLLALRRLLLPLYMEHQTNLRLRVRYVAFIKHHKRGYHLGYYNY